MCFILRALPMFPSNLMMIFLDILFRKSADYYFINKEKADRHSQ